MRLVGITGGIATGKSSVSKMLQEYYGVPVIYTDQAARIVVEPGSDTLKKLVEAFGLDILTVSGEMDRSKVRQLTIHDSDKMKILTQIMWPAISRRVNHMMNNFERAGYHTVCIENAMLIEFGNQKLYDKIVVVTCDPEIQLARVMERDNQSKEDAIAMINQQMPLEEKEKHADFLVVNNGSVTTLRKQVDALYRKIIQEE